MEGVPGVHARSLGGETMGGGIDDRGNEDGLRIEVVIVAAACVITAIICTYVLYAAM